LDPLVVTDEMRPVAVGERTNVIGSRKFKEMIVAGVTLKKPRRSAENKPGPARPSSMCVWRTRTATKNPTWEAFLGHLTKKVKTPLMIDSTDPAVMEAALKLCPGRSVINSMNLEDGEERFAHVATLNARLRRRGGGGLHRRRQSPGHGRDPGSETWPWPGGHSPC
jgi:5-methyltetrahydrofolate--homocysteine methyltransferase